MKDPLLIVGVIFWRWSIKTLNSLQSKTNSKLNLYLRPGLVKLLNFADGFLNFDGFDCSVRLLCSFYWKEHINSTKKSNPLRQIKYNVDYIFNWSVLAKAPTNKHVSTKSSRGLMNVPKCAKLYQ